MKPVLSNYFNDGADPQAQAVLALLQFMWDDEHDKNFHTEAEVGRWENCREQGYVISISGGPDHEQLNIAFFQHRNSDAICAIKWHQTTINTPTIEKASEIDFNGEVYQDGKFDVTKEVGCFEIEEMAKWIAGELEDYVKTIQIGG